MGVALVTIGSVGTPAFSVWGDLFAFVSVFTWTAYWLVSKRARASVGAFEYIASVVLIAALLMTIVALVSGARGWRRHRPPWTGSGSGASRSARARSVMSCSAWSHRHVEAWLGSLITQSMPVVSSVAAWVLLGETLTPMTIVGGLIVLAATAAILVRSRSRTSDDTFAAPETPAPAG